MRWRKTRKIIRQGVLLLAILILGLLIYFYKLDKIPSGFYLDEALHGYNAYSLLLTGKDEYGKAYPLVLRFYGSYNAPLYIYATIPSVAFLGLNVFSVRFVSALSGLLSLVPLFFFLKTSGIIKSKISPYLAALLLVISPWVILQARIGYEVSLAFLIYLWGIVFFWLGLKKPKFLIPGLFFLSLSTYAAYAERLLVPILALGLFVLFRKRLLAKESKKYLFRGIFLAFLIQIPHFAIITTPAFFPKSDLFASEAVISGAKKIGVFLPPFLAVPLAYLREFLSQYSTYFSPRSLFFLPDPDLQRSIPELSVFYFWMIIPYLVGIYFLWKTRKEDFSRLIFILALLSPIPAALTKDPFSTHRAFPHLLPLILIISCGMEALITNFPKKIWIPTFSFLIIFSFILLWRSYFVLLPKERARYWGYGIEKLAEYIKSKPDTKFLIDQTRIKPLYAQLAFFLNYSPVDFQSKVDQSVKENYYNAPRFNFHYQFANIETRNINWEEDIYKSQILVGDEFTISDSQSKEHYLSKVFEILDPVGFVIFRGYQTHPKEKCINTHFASLYCKEIE